MPFFSSYLWNSLQQSWLPITCALLVLIALIPWRQPRAVATLSRWSQAVPCPEESPDGFYARLHGELRARLEERPLPLSSVGFGARHLLSKRTVFSARPVYLAIRYQDLTYYVYAAPAPGGLFVSCWLFSKYALWETNPLLRQLLLRRLEKQTLFQADMIDLFHGIAHGAVTATVDSYLEEQGMPPLEEYEKRPVLHSFYATMKQGETLLANIAPLATHPVGQGEEAGARLRGDMRRDAVFAPEDAPRHNATAPSRGNSPVNSSVISPANSPKPKPATPVRPAQSGIAQSGIAQSGIAQSGIAQSGIAQSGATQGGTTPNVSALGGSVKPAASTAPVTKPAPQPRTDSAE